MERRGNSNRGERLNAEFQKEIYDVIKRKLKNPLVTEMFSVTKTDVSKDLKNAKVFISVFSTNKEKAKTTFDAIVADAKKIRYELAHCMNIRRVPEHHFINDDSMEYSQKISGLLNKIEKVEKID